MEGVGEGGAPSVQPHSLQSVCTDGLGGVQIGSMLTQLEAIKTTAEARKLVSQLKEKVLGPPAPAPTLAPTNTSRGSKRFPALSSAIVSA